MTVAPTMTRLRTVLRRPVLATLMQGRKSCLIIVLVIVAQLAATALGGWGATCPILATTRVPCPGCGLSRSAVALLSGDFHRAAQLHLFGPALLAVLALLLPATILPEPARTTFVGRIESLESSTGISTVILFALLVYWIVRLVYFSATFNAIIRG